MARLRPLALLLVSVALSFGAGAARAEGAPSGRPRAAQKAPKKRPRPRHGHAAQGPAQGLPPAPPRPLAAAPSRPLVDPPRVIERLSLDNGLRVVLAPDRRSPGVAVAMVYDAGSRNEERGSTGLSRLVSYMMSQGSANVLRGDHERLLEARGGKGHRETTSDRTLFVDLVPSSELPLSLWLEADRLKSLQMSPEALAQQREVLAEEQRLAMPLFAGEARLRELVFQAFWPYEHDPGGAVADGPGLKLDLVKGFYETYYASNNAVLTIAGDFEVEHATQLVHRFFETARKQEKPPVFVAPAQPEQTSQRTAVLEDPSRRTPRFLFGWSVPPGRTEESYALSAALSILSTGEGSRLAQRLLRERALATEVSGRTDEGRVASLLSIAVDVVDEEGRAEAEKLVEAEIDALGRAGPTDAEMQRFGGQAEAAAWAEHLPLDARAARLGEFELFHGDARLLGEELRRASAVTREQVRAAVARYLSPSRRTLIELLAPRDPAEPAKRPSSPAGPAARPFAAGAPRAAPPSVLPNKVPAHRSVNRLKRRG